MTVSEFLVSYIKGKGIDSVYAVIGSTAMWLFNALGNEKAIQTICTNHEQAAVMAADGWACLIGKPGVVFLTNGPGVTNAISGIAQAWTDSVPLIIINGESKKSALFHEISTGMRQYGPQSVRTDLIISPFVKYYHLLDNPSDTLSVIEQAYYLASSGRPGPVWISVPIDIQNAPVPMEMKGWNKEAVRVNDNAINDIREIKKALLQAKRPLILAGQGIRLSGAMILLKEFIERYHIPLVTSRMGNDIIESDHPLFVGRPGNWGSRAAHFAIQSADVLLVLGSRLSLNTTGHTPSGFAPQAIKYLVDIDPIEFKKPGITFKKCIQEDVKDFLTVIQNINMDDSMRSIREVWCKRCISWKNRYPVILPEYKTRMPMSTYYFIERLSLLASENDIVLSDTGSCCNIVAQVWNVKKGQRLRMSGGLSCMGYWVTAIGAARANGTKNNKVICVVGDGSLQMNIQELGTIVHYKLPIKLIVINNNGYQIIRISQKAYMHGKYFAVSPETGVGIANTERIAQAYGIAYRKVESLDEIDESIEWVLAVDGAAILEAVVDEDQVMLPRLTSKVKEDGSLQSAAYEDLAPFLSKEELQENMERDYE